MVSVEVLCGPERRRRWSIEQKQAIVAAAHELLRAPVGALIEILAMVRGEPD